MTTDFNIQKRAMIEALEKSLGIVTTAAKLVGIDRSTHYKWMESDPEYKAAVHGIEDIALDFAESKLHKSIESGSDTATIFYLKTKGKKRGYVERQEIAHDNLPTVYTLEIGSLGKSSESKDKATSESRDDVE